jgi:hypothetical protein
MTALEQLKSIIDNHNLNNKDCLVLDINYEVDCLIINIRDDYGNSILDWYSRNINDDSVNLNSNSIISYLCGIGLMKFVDNKSGMETKITIEKK